MKHYDPLVPPDPSEWLAADEQARLDRVLDHHRRARVKLPNRQLHAAIHVIVENQVAMGDEIPVRQALDRLQAEGLDRHEAIHAIGSALAGHVRDLLGAGARQPDVNEAYWTELRRLTAEGWRRSG